MFSALDKSSDLLDVFVLGEETRDDLVFLHAGLHLSDGDSCLLLVFSGVFGS